MSGYEVQLVNSCIQVVSLAVLEWCAFTIYIRQWMCTRDRGMSCNQFRPKSWHWRVRYFTFLRLLELLLISLGFYIACITVIAACECWNIKIEGKKIIWKCLMLLSESLKCEMEERDEAISSSFLVIQVFPSSTCPSIAFSLDLTVVRDMGLLLLYR